MNLKSCMKVVLFLEDVQTCCRQRSSTAAISIRQADHKAFGGSSFSIYGPINQHVNKKEEETFGKAWLLNGLIWTGFLFITLYDAV